MPRQANINKRRRKPCVPNELLIRLTHREAARKRARNIPRLAEVMLPVNIKLRQLLHVLGLSLPQRHRVVQRNPDPEALRHRVHATATRHIGNAGSQPRRDEEHRQVPERGVS